MTRRQLGWAAVVCLGMALPAVAFGEDPWWVVPPRKAAAPAAPIPAVSLGRPVPLASLDRPVPVAEPAWNPQAAPPDAGWNTPTLPDVAPVWNAPTVGPASLAPPASEVMPIGYDPAPGALLEPRVARGQPPDPAPPGALVGPPPIPPAADGAYNTGVAVDQPLRHPFLEGCAGWFNFGSRPSNCGGELFKSDRFCDDSLISPVTNPFFFEDPRALTEIDPLFIITKIPKANGGGNVEFYGVQGRLALSERWSIVINKLGFISLNPSAAEVDGFHTSSNTGFAEVNVGPKWTFWRDECLRNVAAAGLNLELPIGSKSVFQDTGTLGVDPYVTYGQTFGRSSYGSFDFLGETGFSFATDKKRSEFLHASAHIDYDIANWHHLYPLLEMNYFHYTRKGDNIGLDFEGADLVNFGSSALSKRDLLTLAPGVRYKFSDNVQVGTAIEFPLTAEKCLQDVRMTFDLIFRY